MTWLWAASLIWSTAPVADTGLNWWWVAGDSQDSAAVFVDSATLSRNGDRASIQAVRVGRDGTAAVASWAGACGALPSEKHARAVASFACSTNDEHMETAALLGGLTPSEAAQAIFKVRVGEKSSIPPA